MDAPRDEIIAELARWSTAFRTNPVLRAHFVKPLGLAFKGRNGGYWEISPLHNPRELVPAESKAALTLELDEKDFLAIGRGELNPQEAYLTGRLILRGDHDLAIWLFPILEGKPNQ